MRKLIILFCLLYSLSILGQTEDSSIRKKVLQLSRINKEFVFGKWTKKKGNETHLKYLGQVQTTNGETLKVLTSSYIWGLSHRGTNRILFFTENNKYLGYFYVYYLDLPYGLKEGNLLFKTKKECDKNAKTIIDLKQGIPKTIFIRCKGEYGDLYNFSTDE